MKAKLYRYLCLLFVVPSCLAEPEPYVDLALGLGVHVLDETEEGAASQLLKTAVGVQWLPFVSTQIGVWHWSGDEDAKERDDDDEVHPMFEGISLSWELALQVPLNNKYSSLSYGPYYRYGRHCWSAVLSGFVQPWSKEGCSDLQTLGFTFPSGAQTESNAVVYLEFSRTDFDGLSSSSLQVGARLPL